MEELGQAHICGSDAIEISAVQIKIGAILCHTSALLHFRQRRMITKRQIPAAIIHHTANSQQRFAHMRLT